jgi:triosephosphate isomerase
MKKKYIIANWKMNPSHLKEAESLFLDIKKKISKFKNVKTIICPPFVYLGELTYLYSGKLIDFGAQDVFWERGGSFTGEISPEMLKDLGIDYVILGHSERRALGETNEIVSKKVQAAIKAGLNVILCIGESIRDEGGEYLEFLEEEIRKSLKGVSRNHIGRVIIAYEPIWSIGKDTDDAISARQLHQTKLFILKVLKEIYGRKALTTKIIYGGSSTPENTRELLKEGEVDGLLVGHESLKSESFIEMLNIANSL